MYVIPRGIDRLNRSSIRYAVETTSPEGGRQEIQLKGSGRTPFSRSADGLAVLRSGVREYLCAEGELRACADPTTLSLLSPSRGFIVFPSFVPQLWPRFTYLRPDRSLSSPTRKTNS